ncbi:MAG TPA: hypothetical protein VHE56_04255 [Mycobacteriales bacterium]|nr:hypothetical protein [Mycobacteriales bacterium]
MPRRCATDPRLPGLIAAQDHLLHRDQALAAGLTPRAIGHRLQEGQWRLLLPDVYLTHPGEPSRRQLLGAALLYAGPEAAVDGADACRFYGLTSVAVSDTLVHVVAPFGACARSRDFVVVRRTIAAVRTRHTELLRYVEPATAVVAATRRMTSRRSVLAAFSEAAQRRIVTVEELRRAHIEGPPRNSRFGDAALAALTAGTRSAPEEDFRRLVGASSLLPPAEFNVWLRLPGGRVVCADALFHSSAVIHETNGRRAHAREDLFEDMQERHDALTAAGFVVLHNSPRRLREHAREVVAQVERCHLKYEGRGLPEGVEVLPIAA